MFESEVTTKHYYMVFVVSKLNSLSNRLHAKLDGGVMRLNGKKRDVLSNSESKASASKSTIAEATGFDSSDFATKKTVGMESSWDGKQAALAIAGAGAGGAGDPAGTLSGGCTPELEVE